MRQTHTWRERHTGRHTNRDTVRVTERNTHTETHTLKGTHTELPMHTERENTHTHTEKDTHMRKIHTVKGCTHNIQRNTQTDRETKTH